MKKENKNYKECMEAMNDFVISFGELDLMECCDERQHLELATALAGRIADMEPKEDQRSIFKHLSRCLSVVVWRAAEGWQDWEDVEMLAREMVSYLPDGWMLEDVEGLWERAIDEAKKRVPPMHKAYALGNQFVMAAMV